ncbi:hypothetical protein N7520_005727 [Penicillium odoratum]|uniref:uncharacterized protein n=1 Tax=Penicillium odoratum TaxID=1167516 RepID=UPI0025471D66|nr:uncharacterized protein N7520_005727 [Penicillium odoratum]KAJ5758571.1 hypothetical protein N7520_005727 [Penicillium odoratum]
MSGTEQEWKPKIRPQSTMAQAFSSALDSAFSLDSDVNHLSQTVDQKKQYMMIQSRELEALQQRIREAEERLKLQGVSQSTRGHSQTTGKDESSRSSL